MWKYHFLALGGFRIKGLSEIMSRLTLGDVRGVYTKDMLIVSRKEPEPIKTLETLSLVIDEIKSDLEKQGHKNIVVAYLFAEKEQEQ